MKNVYIFHYIVSYAFYLLQFELSVRIILIYKKKWSRISGQALWYRLYTAVWSLHRPKIWLHLFSNPYNIKITKQKNQELLYCSIMVHIFRFVKNIL